MHTDEQRESASLLTPLFVEQLHAQIGKGAVFGILHTDRQNGTDSSEQLAGLVSKHFRPGGLTTRVLFEDPDCPSMDQYLVWRRGGQKTQLLEEQKGGFKYIGNEFIEYGETQYFWPPPIVDLYLKDGKLDVSTASSLWVARGLWREDSQEIIQTLHNSFGDRALVAVFQLCKTAVPVETNLSY